MQHKAIKRGKPEIAFSIFNYIFFTLLCIVMVYPFWHVIMMSLSSVEATAKGGVFLWPKGFNLETYAKVFNDPSIWSGYFTTILVTLSGTFFGTLFTATTAYPLSKKYLPFSKAMLLLVLFTMLFSGGMIPGYLLMKNLGLIDNRLSLILPGLVSAYNVIIMKSFFQSLPESLEESAKIDGATEVTVFWKIILPLSKATIATIALFTGMITSRPCFILIQKRDGRCRRCSAICSPTPTRPCSRPACRWRRLPTLLRPRSNRHPWWWQRFPSCAYIPSFRSTL